MPDLHVLRVFCSPEGRWGNPLGVFLSGSGVPRERRQEVAAELGFSETVFVDDPVSGELEIYTPVVELPFAGHPLVGTAWLLEREHGACPSLRPPAGEATVRSDSTGTYISAPAEWAPKFDAIRLGGPEEVAELPGPPGDADEVYAWAWIDERAGTIRARSFAPGLGIPEDETTGSAVLGLCGKLDRPITVRQGRGSVLIARPLGNGVVEVGGLVVSDERRDHPL